MWLIETPTREDRGRIAICFSAMPTISAILANDVVAKADARPLIAARAASMSAAFSSVILIVFFDMMLILSSSFEADAVPFSKCRLVADSTLDLPSLDNIGSKI
jgi:hypothetical protein